MSRSLEGIRKLKKVEVQVLILQAASQSRAGPLFQFVVVSVHVKLSSDKLVSNCAVGELYLVFIW